MEYKKIYITVYLIFIFLIFSVIFSLNISVFTSQQIIEKNKVLTISILLLVGILEELFFRKFLMGLINKYFTFLMSNIMQSLLYVFFLAFVFHYKILVFLFLFGISQGILYKSLESMWKVILLHLIVDLLLIILFVV